MEPIIFRLRYVVTCIGLTGAKQVVFSGQLPDTISVTLQHVANVEIPFEYSDQDLLCEALLTRKPTAKIAEWMTGPDGPSPSGFEHFCDKAFEDLSLHALRLVALLRWRNGFRPERQPNRRPLSFEWSFDGDLWHSISLIKGLRIVMLHRPPLLIDVLASSTTEMWQSGVEAPLARELHQEAWEQCEKNPRSALVICIAAVEAAVKQLVSTAVPNAKWLIENLPSPPIVSILQDYVPMLTTRVLIDSKPLGALPKDVIDVLKKGVRQRNELVHGKPVSPHLDSVRELLATANDVLYYCDLWAEQLWAFNMLSPSLQKQLKEDKC